MDNAELIKSIVEKSGYDKKVVDSVFTALSEIIKSSMAQEDIVPLADIGSFRVSNKSARTSRDPFTGEKIEIPEKRVLKFKFSNSVKENIK